MTTRALPLLLLQSAYHYRSLAVIVVLLCSARVHDAHNEDAPPEPCASDMGVTVEAEYRPGLITLDADSKDWAGVRGYEFPLRMAINVAETYPMDPGSIQIKVGGPLTALNSAHQSLLSFCGHHDHSSFFDPSSLVPLRLHWSIAQCLGYLDETNSVSGVFRIWTASIISSLDSPCLFILLFLSHSARCFCLSLRLYNVLVKSF